MADVTRILSAIEQGDGEAAEQLLPLVYDELRRLAAQRMAKERPGQTLDGTALVHEAYLRLVDVEKVRHWHSRGHFFAAAAQAMRRILVDRARSRKRLKRGAGLMHHSIAEEEVAASSQPEEILAIDDALARLASTNELAARLVTLRYFAGFTIAQAAEALGVSSRKANQIWAYARAWLLAEMAGESSTNRVHAP